MEIKPIAKLLVVKTQAKRLYEKSGKVANRCSTRRRKRLKGASLDVSRYRRPPIAEPRPPFHTVSTASLMRNHLLNTACRGHIEGRKGHKDAQKDAERYPKSRSLSEAALSDAVGGPQRVEKLLVPFSEPHSGA